MVGLPIIRSTSTSLDTKSLTPCLKDSWLLQPTAQVHPYQGLQLTLQQAAGKQRTGRRCPNRRHTQPQRYGRGPQSRSVLTPRSGPTERSLRGSDVMVITQAAKEKASVFLKGESSVQRHGAPTEAQGSSAQMSHPPGRGEQPCQSLGCPEEELGDKLMVCHPNRASTQRSHQPAAWG